MDRQECLSYKSPPAYAGGSDKHTRSRRWYMFVDSHAHIDGPEFDADRDEIIDRARAAGVSAILNVGTGDPNSGAFERAIKLSDRHQNVFAAIGVHPHDARLFDAEAEQRLIAFKIVRCGCWGEIG